MLNLKLSCVLEKLILSLSFILYEAYILWFIFHWFKNILDTGNY